MFLVTNIDEMYKEMKKIVEVGNKHRNGDEYPDFLSIYFFFGIIFFRVGRSIGNTHIFFFGLIHLFSIYCRNSMSRDENGLFN